MGPRLRRRWPRRPAGRRDADRGRGAVRRGVPRRGSARPPRDGRATSCVVRLRAGSGVGSPRRHGRRVRLRGPERPPRPPVRGPGSARHRRWRSASRSGFLNRHGLIAGATGTGQDAHPPAHRRADLGRRLPGLRRRHEGRPGRHRRGRGRPTSGSPRARRSSPMQWTPAACPGGAAVADGRRTAWPCGRRSPSSARRCSRRCWSSTRRRSRASGSSSATATRRASRSSTSRTCAPRSPTSPGAGKAELKAIGGISSATAGVLLRKVSQLEADGGDVFFGEPAFEVADLLRTAPDGRGIVSVLDLVDVARAAGALLHLPDVGAGRAVRVAARGRRPRQADAGVLLRRGPPALRRGLRRRSSTRSPRPCA